MSEQKAPERISISYCFDGSLADERYPDLKYGEPTFDVEYTRSDIATAPKEEAERYRKALSSVLDAMIDPCRFDHEGYCQAHFIEKQCRVALAREALAGKQTTFACNKCGYVGATERHDGCMYSAVSCTSGKQKE